MDLCSFIAKHFIFKDQMKIMSEKNLCSEVYTVNKGSNIFLKNYFSTLRPRKYFSGWPDTTSKNTQCSIKTNNDVVCRAPAELAIFQLRFFFFFFFFFLFIFCAMMAQELIFLHQNMKTCAIGAMAQPGLNTDANVQGFCRNRQSQGDILLATASFCYFDYLGGRRFPAEIRLLAGTGSCLNY